MTIIKKFDTSEIDKSKTGRSSLFNRKYISLTAISLFILVVLEVWASNTVVTYGEKFEGISLLQQSLRMENQILENEIAKRASLANIASQSAMLGFSKSQEVQYIR